jgi:hypothetical protein
VNYLRAQANKSIKIFDFIKEQNLQHRVHGDEVFICCPFHKDKNPSCSVSLTKEIFRCFGCQITGDRVFLVARLLKKPIDEVINLICVKYGIQYPKSLDEVSKKDEPDWILDELVKRRDEIGMKCIECGYILREARRLMLNSAIFSDEAKFYFDVEMQYDVFNNNYYHYQFKLKDYCIKKSIPYPKFSVYTKEEWAKELPILEAFKKHLNDNFWPK